MCGKRAFGYGGSLADTYWHATMVRSDEKSVAGLLNRYRLDYIATQSDRFAAPDGDGAQDFRPRADEDAVFEGGMAPARRPGRAAKRDAVIERDIGTDDRCLADDDARAMVDEAARADPRAGLEIEDAVVPVGVRHTVRITGETKIW